MDSLGIEKGIAMLYYKEDRVMLLEVHRPLGHVSHNNHHNNLNNLKVEKYDKGDLSNFSLGKPLLLTLLF